MTNTQHPSQRDRKIPSWVLKLTEFTDRRYRLPFTDFRFGWDSIIGLIPGFGDLAGFLLGLVILYGAWQAGASLTLLGRMFSNLVLDWTLGTLPVVGDAFDFYFRANHRNLDLLRRKLAAA